MAGTPSASKQNQVIDEYDDEERDPLAKVERDTANIRLGEDVVTASNNPLETLGYRTYYENDHSSSEEK